MKLRLVKHVLIALLLFPLLSACGIIKYLARNSMQTRYIIINNQYDQPFAGAKLKYSVAYHSMGILGTGKEFKERSLYFPTLKNAGFGLKFYKTESNQDGLIKIRHWGEFITWTSVNQTGHNTFPKAIPDFLKKNKALVLKMYHNTIGPEHHDASNPYIIYIWSQINSESAKREYHAQRFFYMHPGTAPRYYNLRHGIIRLSLMPLNKETMLKLDALNGELIAQDSNFSDFAPLHGYTKTITLNPNNGEFYFRNDTQTHHARISVNCAGNTDPTTMFCHINSYSNLQAGNNQTEDFDFSLKPIINSRTTLITSHVDRPWAHAYGHKQKYGQNWLGLILDHPDAEIVAVERYSPADLARPLKIGNTMANENIIEHYGLKKGDRIVQFDGETVDFASDVLFLLLHHPPERTILLDILRENRKYRYSINPGSKDIEDRIFKNSYYDIATHTLIAELTRFGKHYFNIPGLQRVLVDQATDKLKHMRGDILLTLDNKPVKSIEDFKSIQASYYKQDKPIKPLTGKVALVHNGSIKDITFKSNASEH